MEINQEQLGKMLKDTADKTAELVRGQVAADIATSVDAATKKQTEELTKHFPKKSTVYIIGAIATALGGALGYGATAFFGNKKSDNHVA